MDKACRLRCSPCPEVACQRSRHRPVQVWSSSVARMMTEVPQPSLHVERDDSVRIHRSIGLLHAWRASRHAWNRNPADFSRPLFKQAQNIVSRHVAFDNISPDYRRMAGT